MLLENQIYFVTANPNKVRSPKAILAEFGIEVVHLQYGIPEFQAATSKEVAYDKAEWVGQRVREPFFVADTSLHIPIIGGFPGAYVKWVTRQIGVDGYLRLLAPWPDPKNRACFFQDSIACKIDPGTPLRLFIRIVSGRVADEARGEEGPETTSTFWKLFIPAGFDKTLAEMSVDELAAFRAGIREPYEQLARLFLSCK